jgi:hypothetical protein
MNRKFVVGLDKSKMKFYDVSASAQQSLVHVNSENGKVFSVDSDDEDAPFDARSSQKFNKKFGDWG